MPYLKVREAKVSYKTKGTVTCPLITSPEASHQVSLEVIQRDSETIVENFIVLMMASDHELIGYSLISKGNIDETLVDMRVLFQKILLTGAVKIVLAHNHPSGNLNPSTNDINLTISISDGCNLFDIALEDHIIIDGQGQWYSMREHQDAVW